MLWLNLWVIFVKGSPIYCAYSFVRGLDADQTTKGTDIDVLPVEKQFQKATVGIFFNLSRNGATSNLTRLIITAIEPR